MRRLLTFALICALCVAPAALGAPKPVAIGSLTINKNARNITLKRGVKQDYRMAYTVRGPAATAHVRLVVDQDAGPWKYTITGNPSRVREGVWRWSFSEKLPVKLPKGSYTLRAEVWLTNGTVARASTARHVTVA